MFTVSQNQIWNFIFSHLYPLRFRNVLFLKDSFYYYLFMQTNVSQQYVYVTRIYNIRNHIQRLSLFASPLVTFYVLILCRFICYLLQIELWREIVVVVDNIFSITANFSKRSPRL
jgi:hypothetical protein